MNIFTGRCQILINGRFQETWIKEIKFLNSFYRVTKHQGPFKIWFVDFRVFSWSHGGCTCVFFSFAKISYCLGTSTWPAGKRTEYLLSSRPGVSCTKPSYLSILFPSSKKKRYSGIRNERNFTTNSFKVLIIRLLRYTVMWWGEWSVQI